MSKPKTICINCKYHTVKRHPEAELHIRHFCEFIKTESPVTGEIVTEYKDCQLVNFGNCPNFGPSGETSVSFKGKGKPKKVKTITIIPDYSRGIQEMKHEVFHCPNCESDFIMKNDSYCANCGCRIDWNLIIYTSGERIRHIHDGKEYKYSCMGAGGKAIIYNMQDSFAVDYEDIEKIERAK